MPIEETKQSGRKTGIDILGYVPWGTHFCLFYKTKEDLIDILVPYFKTGLENNEFCMWVTSEPLNKKEAEKALREAVPNFDEHLKKGQIEILPYNRWYLKGGTFDLQAVLDAWVDRLNQALASGFVGMRVTGNTAWLEKKDWRNFADYEKEVNKVIGKYRMVAICSYCLDKCGASEIIDVVNSHRFTLIRRGGKWEVIKSAERKKAEQALRESEEKYRSLVTNIPDVTWTTDNKGNTVFISPNIEKVYGYTPEEIYKKGDRLWFGRVHPNDVKKLKETYKALFEKGIRFNVEYRIKKKNGEWIWLHDRSIVTYEKDGVMYADGVFSDITEHKKAEEKIKMFSSAVEGAYDCFLLTDMNGNVTYANESAIKAFGYTFDEITKLNTAQLNLDPEDAKEIMEEIKTKGNWSGEVISLRKNKEGFPTILSVSLIKDEKGKAIATMRVFRDITERKRVEKKLLNYQKRLRDLASEISLTEERERRRIAIELHDQITQNLILFKINIGLLRDNKLPAEFVKPLDKIYELIDQIIQDTRSLTFDLGSPTLYEIGLEAAVREWLDEEIRQKHGIKTEFESDGQLKPLDGDICILLYRVVRELLINVVKHAQAHYVKVSICQENGNIHINVVDDGVGFKPFLNAFDPDGMGGFGFFSIRERLSHFGGSVEVESEPGHGTRVAVAVPIKCGKTD